MSAPWDTASSATVAKLAVSNLLSVVRDHSCKYLCFDMAAPLVLQIWLPIRLIQNRVENEIKNNLTAVQKHSEALHGRKDSMRARQI